MKEIKYIKENEKGFSIQYIKAKDFDIKNKHVFFIVIKKRKYKINIIKCVANWKKCYAVFILNLFKKTYIDMTDLKEKLWKDLVNIWFTVKVDKKIDKIDELNIETLKDFNESIKNVDNTIKVFNMMKKQKSNWYELLSKKEQFSEYLVKNHISTICSWLQSEVSELFEEIVKYEKDSKNIEELLGELNDVIYMMLQLSVKLMQQWLLENFENNWLKQKNKIFHRAPHLKKGIKINLEEEKRIWAERKWKI